MRFVVIHDVVINVEAIDMIVPQDKQCTVYLRGGSEKQLEVSADALLKHVHHTSDEVLRVLNKEEAPHPAERGLDTIG
jgi:hypothetical protein